MLDSDVSICDLRDDTIEGPGMIALPQMYQTNNSRDDSIEGSGMIALPQIISSSNPWEINAMIHGVVSLIYLG